MTEKRFTYHTDGCLMEWISDSKDGERVSPKCATEWLNTLYEENEQLRREKGKLEVEIECLSDELRQCKAVIDKRWNEYLEKKGDVE